jgi:hypothetical protein
MESMTKTKKIAKQNPISFEREKNLFNKSLQGST